MNRRWAIIFIALVMIMTIKPALAQVSTAIEAAITANINIDYTNVTKHEMKLKLTCFAIANWEVDIAVRGDNGTTYYIKYKNGYGNAVINGTNITEYLGSSYYSSAADQWVEVTAPKTINNSLLLAADSFSGDTAQLMGIRISGNAIAVDSVNIVDNQGNGFKETFNYSAFSGSPWQLENSTTGMAEIDTTYASQGYYSVRLMSVSLMQQQQAAQQQAAQQQTAQQQGTIYPTTGYPQQYGAAYPQQYGAAYPQQYGAAYPQQYGAAYPQQYGAAYPQQYGGIQDVSYGAGGVMYGYNPQYLQGGTVTSPYGQSSGQTWYTGQIGQQTGYAGQTAYGAQTMPMASPYAGAYAYPASYAGGAAGAFPGALGTPFAGYGAPIGGLGAPLGLGGFGLPGAGLGLGGFGLPGAGLGLGGFGLPAAGLGLGGFGFAGAGMPGFSSFDPIGLALFGGGLLF